MSAADAASLAHWESMADWGTWLVIIGVAGEGLEIALKISEQKIKNARFLNWYKTHSFGIEIWGCIFWIMVVLGLLLEHKGNQRAQILVKTENSRITKEAGSAVKSAGEAIERAAIAEKQAGQANELAARIGMTSTWLVASNLSLAHDVLTLAAFVDETNTLTRLNEEKTALADVERVRTDVRNLVGNSSLGEVKGQMAETHRFIEQQKGHFFSEEQKQEANQILTEYRGTTFFIASMLPECQQPGKGIERSR